MLRFEAIPYKWWKLKSVMARNCRKWLPRLLIIFPTSTYDSEGHRLSISLSYSCHTYDLEPDPFGLDCRAVYSVAIILEGIIGDDSNLTDSETLTEEIVSFAYLLSEFGPLDYLDKLEKAFDILSKPIQNDENKLMDFFENKPLGMELIRNAC